MKKQEIKSEIKPENKKIIDNSVQSKIATSEQNIIGKISNVIKSEIRGLRTEIRDELRNGFQFLTKLST